MLFLKCFLQRSNICPECVHNGSKYVFWCLKTFWRPPHNSSNFVKCSGVYSNCYHAEHVPKILNPTTEQRPHCVRNGFRKMSIFHHISHLQVLLSHYVVRHHYPPGCFDNKVLTKTRLTLRYFRASLFLNLALFLEPFFVLDIRR